MSKYGRPDIAGNMLANDKNVIIYRKELNKLTSSVTASLLLKQAMYWDKKTDGEFYKFISSCNHDLYEKEDSWIEELGFTKYEFRGAIKKIGFKRGKSKNKIDNEEDAYIIYYTDNQRLTWWMVNWEKLNQDLKKIYKNPEYLVFGKNQNTKANRKNQNTITTETTAEINTETSKQVELADNINNQLSNLINRRIKDKELDKLSNYNNDDIKKAIKKVKSRDVDVKSVYYLIPIIKEIEQDNKKLESTVSHEEVKKWVDSLETDNCNYN